VNSNTNDEYFPWEGVVSAYLYKNWSSLSDSDKFTNVWIAFNSWMKGQFGVKKTDADLINSTINYKALELTFEYLRRSDESFENSLLSLLKYEITNQQTSKTIRYNGTFESLIRTLYIIRGNIFHGTNTSGMNNKLHRLAFDILYRLLNKHIYPNTPDAGPPRL